MYEHEHEDNPMKTNFRTIVWEGIYLTVPHNWEVASYLRPGKEIYRLCIEDEYCLRMEIEWTQTFNLSRRQRILKQHKRQTHRITRKATYKNPIDALPGSWTATGYTFAQSTPGKMPNSLGTEELRIAVAFFDHKKSGLFGRTILYFHPGDPETPGEVMRCLARGFSRQEGPAIPWQVFDISFRSPPQFRLEEVDFDVGAKHLRFDRQGRRLHLWFFSCADAFLPAAPSPAHWIAGYLNSFGGIRSRTFFPLGKDAITHCRRRALLGHWEEIGRWCFRYHIGWRLDKKKEQLIVWVFNHRRETDLARLPEEYRET